MVSMQPESATALDIAPYNIFTLRCVANAPEGVLLEKTFEWRNGGNIIRDNGNTVLISHRNTTMPRSTSELIVNNPSVGSQMYFCTVTMSVLGGVDLVAHSSASVIVRGMGNLNPYVISG